MAEEIAIDLIIDISRSAKNLSEVTDTLKVLNAALDNVDEGSESFKKLSKQIEISDKKLIDFAITADKSKLTLNELGESADILNDELGKVGRNSKEFELLQAALIEVNREIETTETSLSGLNSADVAGEFGALTGAAGTLTSSFVLLGGEGNETFEEIGNNIQRAIGISQAFQGSIEGIISGTKLYKNFSKQIKNNNILTKAASVVQAGYNKVQNLTGKAVNNTSRSLKGFKTALIATGIGLIVVLIGTLIANWDKLTEAISGVSEEQKVLNKVQKESLAAVAEELSALDKLTDKINDETLSREQKVKAVQDLQAEYPDLLSNIDAEKVTTEELNVAIRLNTQLVRLQAEAKAIAETRSEKYKEQLENELDATTGANVGILDHIISLQGIGTAQEIANAKTAQANRELEKGIVILDDREKALQKNITALQKSLGVDDAANQARKDAEDAAKEADDNAKKRADAGSRRADEIKRQQEKDAADEIKRLQDLDSFKESIFQKGLDSDEERQVRRLTLEFEANLQRAEKLIKNEEDLQRTIQTIRDQVFQDIEKIENKSIELEKEKANKIIEVNKRTNAILSVLEAEKELLDAERIDDEIMREEAKATALIKLNQARIDKINVDAELQLRNEQLTSVERVEIEKRAELEIARIRQEGRDTNLERDKEDLTTRSELIEQLVQATFEVVQTLSDTAFQLINDAREADFQKRRDELTESFNFENDQINRRVELGIKTERVAVRERKKLAKEQRESEIALEKEAFDQKKKTDKSQALINGALAITQIFASTPPPASFILAAVQVVNTAAQVAVINRQKFGKGGILKGPSHAEGGIQTPFGEMEGEEIIINKRSSKMFRSTLSKINEAGGGIKFARGGITPSISNSPTSNNTNLEQTISRLNETLNRPIETFVVEEKLRRVQQRAVQLEANADV